jgi:hypothetical protein
MKFIKSKKGIALLAVLVVAAVAAIGGYAYFTSTGTGTGSASVGTATNWSVGQTATSGGALYPDAAVGGANVQTKTYHVKNVGSGSQYLTQVVISVANSDGSAWYGCAGDATPDATTHICGGGTSGGGGLVANGKAACRASDFSVGAASVGAAKTDTALAGDFTAGQDKTNGSVTVEMIDNNANQDACQGLTTVPLYFSAS